MTTGKTIALTRWTFVVRELLFRKERHLRLREFHQVPAPQYAFLRQKGHEVCIPCHKTIDMNTGLLSHYQPRFEEKKKTNTPATCRLFPPAARGPLASLRRLSDFTLSDVCLAQLPENWEICFFQCGGLCQALWYSESPHLKMYTCSDRKSENHKARIFCYYPREQQAAVI